MTAEALAAGHLPLLREVGELRMLARRVLEAHRAEDGKRLREVRALISDLLEDLECHLRDEEAARFAPNAELRRDHAQVRLLLADLRRHTDGYRAQAGACGACLELWRRLAGLDEALCAQLSREEDFTAAERRRRADGGR